MIDAVRRALIAGAASLLLPWTSAAAVTRLRVAGDRVFLPVTVNGRATEALLDSAAEATVLDAAFAARLGLTGGTAVTAHGTGRATTTARLVTGVAIGAAGLTLRPAGVAVVDLSDISARLTHAPIDVVLGRELFDAARLAIDIGGGTLTVLDRSGEPAGVRLALTGRRGIETVPLTIEGWAAQADFDLGIGGETVQTAFDLTRVELAGQAFDDVPVAIDGNPTAADANIGVALLKNFRIVADFAQRAVWLDPR